MTAVYWVLRGFMRAEFRTTSKKTGFTLLELSVVILVIGLLVGGILVGDQIQRAAEIRKTINEVNDYKMSFSIFKDKFGTYPGDLRSASSSLGCTAGTFPVGCNGNQDGTVTVTGSPVGQGDEQLRAWQHLSLANLIDKQYPGIATVLNQNDIGINVPKAKVYDKAGFYVHTLWFNGYPGNGTGVYFTLGSLVPNNYNYAPSIAPNELKEIDLKMDDGLPKSGEVLGGWPNTCITNAGAGTEYASSNAILCDAAFLIKYK